MYKLLLSLVFIFGLSGCFGPPTFDATNDDTIKKSISSMNEGLSEDKKEKLKNAIMYFSIGGMEGLNSLMADSLKGQGNNAELAISVNLQSIHSLTVEEILAKYDVVLAEKKRIRKQKEAEEKEREKERKEVRKLMKEAEALLKEKQFEKSIAIYNKISELPSGYADGYIGIQKATKELNTFTRKMAAIKNIEITEFTAKRIDTYSKKGVPAVRIGLKNNGDESLDEVEVIVYFYDSEGNVIYEEDYHPVLVSSYSFGSKPLKPGYVNEMESGKYYTLDSTLKDWDESKATIKIVDVEFSN